MDNFLDRSSNKMGKSIILHDSKEGHGKVNMSGNVIKKFSDNPVYNTYNRKSQDYEPDYNLFVPSVSFNPDDGFLLGFLASRTTFGYKQDPFATLNRISGTFALATAGIRLKYNGDFNDLFGNWGIKQEAIYQSSLYTTNFYGFGNDTENEEERLGMNFNRVRQNLISYKPQLFRGFNSRNFYYVGPTFEYITIEDTPNRIFDIVETGVSDKIFDGLAFLGIEGGINFQNTDDADFPTKGLSFDANIGFKSTLNNEDQSFGYLDAKLGLYQKLDRKGNFVFATRVGVSHRFNNDFNFYHGAKLGGIGPGNNFRALRRDRYIGRTAFFQNIDLRLKILHVDNTSLPLSMGIFGGFDQRTGLVS